MRPTLIESVIGFLTLLIAMVQIASVVGIGYILYYIYQHGLEQLFNVIWTGVGG